MDQITVPKRMKILVMAVYDQRVGPTIARSTRGYQTWIAHDNDRVVRSILIYVTRAYVKRLMKIPDEMHEHSQGVALTHRMVWIGIVLQDSNAGVDEMNDIVIRCKPGASVVTCAA